MKKIMIIATAALAAAAVITSVLILHSRSDKEDLQKQLNAGSVTELTDDSTKEEENDPFSLLLNANIGDKVITGVTFDTVGSKVPDNWYKLDEDDENICRFGR